MSAFAPDTKIPVTEKKFLIDQRTTRKMPQKGTKEKLNVLTSSDSSQSDSDVIFQPQSQASTSWAPVDKPTTTNSTVDFTSLSRTCDRCGVSDRARAVITIAVLHTSILEITDKNKLRKLLIKLKIARQLVAEEDKVLQIPASYFDGRKNKTLIISEKDGKMYSQSIPEDRISLIMEPESKSLGYIAPAFGTSKCIEQAVLDFFLESKNIYGIFGGSWM
ncbi:hypothetical protein AVEN_118317-1 [Araneus ventricosus]|uniref:Uncharacterized protein n=1 Tax=Araneus ventricosus TaxID=182803 RepID=A0A4Y2B4V4_ARAVE|nr:hypothetical protein AVEN_118317-1 [Araneus ventricosus]